MILAGIDEAGLGPVLGPLVVSATAFRVDEDPGEAGLWSRLNRCVVRDSKHAKKSGLVAIATARGSTRAEAAGGLHHWSAVC